MQISDRDRLEAKEIAAKLWRHFNDRKWDEARKLLADDFEAVWPQSCEKIVGPDNFITLNREYPGTGTIEVYSSRYGYEEWEHIHEVTTITNIKWIKPDGKEEEVYTISLFNIDSEGLILSVEEYWAETYPAPEWRKHLAQKY